jgi:hypothetical protein
MADVTINDLGDLAPQGSLYVPISNGATTGKARLSAINVDYANVTGKPTLATVATTGSYNDLIGKPTSLQPKAWVAFNGRTTNGACTIYKQYNVASVDRTNNTAGGLYTITFTVAMDGTYHCAMGTGNGVNTVTYDSVCNFFSQATTTSIGPLSFPVNNGATVGTYDPINNAFVAIYG